MPSSEKEKLLNDVLRDANYEEFRRDLLELSSVEFRKNHSHASQRWWALAASLLAGAIIWSLWSRPLQHFKIPGNPVAETAPAVEYVASEKLRDEDVVRSIPDRSLVIETPLRRRPDPNLLITSETMVNELTDSQLLALFPNRPAGFVQTDEGREFVVLDRPRRVRLGVAQ